MLIEENKSLKPFTSFGSNEISRYFITVTSIDALLEAITWAKEKNIPYSILGAGTNVLFTKPFEGLVIKMEIVGIVKTNETAAEVYLNVGAGEHWHHFVCYCVQKGWGGIENLSLIPGTVGASAIQNIGAYGVEVQEAIASVTAVDTVSQQLINFTYEACKFSYRNSLFKKEKNRYIVTSVQFILHKQPTLRTEYGNIKETLREKGIKNPSLEDLSNAIIQIRTAKLPDPSKLKNAGSFFKNPTISIFEFEKLKTRFPKIIAYPISNDLYKVSAEWLIAYCGWKGCKKGNVGCHEKQSLVILNYGNATGKEIFNFSEEIIQSVFTELAILLEREVEVY